MSKTTGSSTSTSRLLHKPSHRQLACYHVCRVSGDALQDIIVGGAVVASAGAALWNGLKGGSVELCDLCGGNGTNFSAPGSPWQ